MTAAQRRANKRARRRLRYKTRRGQTLTPGAHARRQRLMGAHDHLLRSINNGKRRMGNPRVVALTRRQPDPHNPSQPKPRRPKRGGKRALPINVEARRRRDAHEAAERAKHR